MMISKTMAGNSVKKRRTRRLDNIFAQFLALTCMKLLPASGALSLSLSSAPSALPAYRSRAHWYSSSRTRIHHDSILITLYSKQNDSGGDENNSYFHDSEIQSNNVDTLSPYSIPSVVAKTRRQFFQQQLLSSSLLLPPTITNAATSSTTNNSNNYDAPSTAIENYFSLRNNNNIPNSNSYAARVNSARQQQQQQQQFQNERQRANDKAISSSAKRNWTPFVNVNKWDSVEKCLLEMLPVKNGVFRKLQELIEGLEAWAADDTAGWRQTLLDTLTTLSLLESKRSSLEPVFNQQDPTELFINKSTIGERNIEVLRSQLETLVRIASAGMDIDLKLGGNKISTVLKDGYMKSSITSAINNGDELGLTSIDGDVRSVDAEAFREGKRQALLALSEVGELLVPSFPYAVPTRGKFGYLPRLLGRCTVTFCFERPTSSSNSFGARISGDNKRFLGNITIVADGYAAPITAGNFVDLSLRNFYTGLNVKAMRKRLGVVPSWSDNVIVNDLTELKDNLDVLKDDFGSALPEALMMQQGVNYSSSGKKGSDAGDKSDTSSKGGGRGIGGMFRTKQQVDDDPFGYTNIVDDSQMMMDVVLPILGSFQEGFYDPLTAKPRRIPLEVVALGGSGPNKATLTYSSSFASIDDDVKATGTTKYSALTSSSSPQRSFSSSTSSSSSTTAAAATSNFRPVLSFDIPNIVAMNHPDRVSNGGSSEFFSLPIRDISPKRTKLLDGQYAPFGYIIRGSDVYQTLKPGDVISATYVSELGALNLVKIRKNAFESGEEAMVEEEKDS